MAHGTSPRRSPLKVKPLRYPGQSIDERLRRIIDDWGDGWGLAAALLVALTGYEWLCARLNLPRQPWAFTLLALVAVGIAAWQFRRLKRETHNLKLGRDGEKTVGQILDELRALGARIFHDVPAENFNLDHVVVSPHGIYVVETKTRSKPAGDARVVFDGERVQVAGCAPERDPVAQVHGASAWLKRRLSDSTGRSFAVRGVIAYPGWFVDNSRARGSSVWVLEPKAIGAWMEREAVSLSDEDVAMVSDRLAQHVRGRGA